MLTNDDKIEVCKLLKEVLNHAHNISDLKVLSYDDILYGIDCVSDDLVNKKLRGLRPNE